MTAAAAQRVQVLAKEEGNPALMLRLAVSGGGCSGFSYNFSMDADATSDDRVFEFHGSKLVVDETSMDLLKGCQFLLSFLFGLSGCLGGQVFTFRRQELAFASF